MKFAVRKPMAVFVLLAAGFALRAGAEGFSVSESGNRVQVNLAVSSGTPEAPEALALLKSMGFLSYLPPGNPDLPVQTIRIAIPAEGDYTYTWQDDPVPVKGTIPMQFMGTDDVETPADLPTGAVKFAGEGWFRQVRYLAFHLYPLRVGEDGTAVLSRTLSVAVHFDGAYGYAVRDLADFDSVYGQLFINTWQDKGAAGGSAVDASAGASSYHPALVPGSTAYKITVRSRGIYKLDYSFFSGRNIPITTMSDLHIQNQGTDVPFYWDKKGSGSAMGVNDAIYFYGVPYTGENNAALWQHGDYTDDNVYWVFMAATAGTVMATRSVAPYPYTIPTQFTSSVTFEQNLLFTPFDPVLNDDLWLWMESSWYAGNSSPTNADHVVTVPSVATTLGFASLTFNARAVSYDTAVNPDHQVTLSLNSHTLGTFSFDGLNPVTQTYASIPMSDLNQGTASNTLRMAVGNPSTLGVPFEIVRSNNFTLTYQRRYEAYLDALEFYHTGDNWKFSVTNFTWSGNTLVPLGVDVTTPAAPVWLTNITSTKTGTSSYTWTETLTDSNWAAQHTLYLALPTVPAGADVTADVSSALDALNVNWILIGPSAWLSLSSVQSLQSLRQAQGYTTALVDIQDVYDEFSYGIMSPQAVQAFLSHVYNYSAPPQLLAVVLLGDGTFDYKNYAGFGSLNIVPAFMIHDNTGGTTNVPIAQYAWDDYYGCLSGSDILPDIFVGRIPAETAADVNNALAKIIGYASPPSTSFLNTHLFAAGCRDGGTWDVYQDANAATVRPSPMTAQKIYFGLPPWNTSFTNCNTQDSNGDGINDVNQAFINALNAGVGTISYIGHGSFQFWDDNTILQNSDLALLTNAARPAIFLNADCYTSAYYFSYDNPSILQAALLDAGGSVASGGPGGFMYNFQSPYLTLPFYQDLFGLNKERTVGALLMQNVVTMLNSGDTRATEGYVKLGDMLAQVPLPAPAAPTSVQANAACRAVALSWASPYTQFNVFRGSSASGPWTAIGSSSTHGYTDSTGTYGSTYYYRVAAVDGSGNEGKGSAAVSATLTPCAPQAPQGVACQNPQLGGRLTVTWTASTEPEVTGYIVKWGAAAGVYTQSKSVGAVGSAPITGLTDGTPVHIAVQAVNSFGLQSPLSADTVCSSSHELGWAPPQMVFPLKLAKDTDGAPLLRWTLPASSIWGGSVSVDKCSVYRAATANHYPDRSDASSDRISYVQASACSGGACAYRDATAPSSVFYMITCQTSKGEESPVEAPPPAPLASVYTELDGVTGCMYLTWTPVPYDMGQSPDTLVNYGVYRGLASTFTPDVRNGTNRVGQDLWELNDCPPDSQTYYYKVMGKDTKGNTGPY